jgi:hypothetical protein
VFQRRTVLRTRRSIAASRQLHRLAPNDVGNLSWELSAQNPRPQFRVRGTTATLPRLLAGLGNHMGHHDFYLDSVG